MSSPDNPTKYENQKIAKRPSAVRKAERNLKGVGEYLTIADHCLAIGDRDGAAKAYRAASVALAYSEMLMRLAAVQVMPNVDPSSDTDTDTDTDDDAIRAERSIPCLDQIESDEDYIAAFGADEDGGGQ